MRTYRVSVIIENIDHGPAEHSEIHLGNVHTEAIAPLIAVASTLASRFVGELHREGAGGTEYMGQAEAAPLVLEPEPE